MPVIGPRPTLEFAHLNHLFVNVQPNVNTILHLTRQARNKRIISFVGPPGVGKSWLLNWVYWAMHPAPNPGAEQMTIGQEFWPIYLGLSQANPDMLEAELSDWLDHTLDALGMTIAPTIPFTTRFLQFAQQICTACGNCLPVLLLDGFEELDRESREFVAVQVLKQFLIEPPAEAALCTRAILTKRDKQRLTDEKARYLEEVHELRGWLPQSAEPEQQVERLLDFLADPANPLDLIRSELYRNELTMNEITAITARAQGDRQAAREALAPFLSGNPLINIFLVANFLLDPQGIVTRNQLVACQRRYMEHTLAGYPATVRDEALEQLRDLIDLLQDATLNKPPADLSAWTTGELDDRREARQNRDGRSPRLDRLRLEELTLLSDCGIIAKHKTIKNAKMIDPAFVKHVNDTARLA